MKLRFEVRVFEGKTKLESQHPSVECKDEPKTKTVITSAEKVPEEFWWLQGKSNEPEKERLPLLMGTCRELKKQLTKSRQQTSTAQDVNDRLAKDMCEVDDELKEVQKDNCKLIFEKAAIAQGAKNTIDDLEFSLSKASQAEAVLEKLKSEIIRRKHDVICGDGRYIDIVKAEMKRLEAFITKLENKVKK